MPDSEISAPPPAKKLWMLTFADLLSLMLTFFVMLFSMNQVHNEKWHQVVETLNQRLNPGRPNLLEPPSLQPSVAKPVNRRAISLEYLKAVLDDKLAQDPLLAAAHVQLGAGRLVISLPADLLFDLGRAELQPSARAALFELGGMISNLKNEIGVQGHTDPQPIHGGPYPSNWELSLVRAVVVANALRAAGYGREIIAFGYGDTRFDALPSGMDLARRQQLARRVEIVVLPTPSDP